MVITDYRFSSSAARTLIAAGVLAGSGLEPERAIEIVSSARGQTVPETPDQRSWVQRLPARPSVVMR